MILPKVRNPRLITVRRGETLSDADHQLFEDGQPSDPRPRDAIEAACASARGDMKMMDARARGGHAMAAARWLMGASRFAAYAAGQAARVGHVPEHDLGAAAYAIKAANAAPSVTGSDQLHEQIRALVLEDQTRRYAICWSVFEDRQDAPSCRSQRETRAHAAVGAAFDPSGCLASISVAAG